MFKEFIGERHEITESVREGLADRLSSPFYGYFLVSWFIVNWDFVYSALFVDGKIIYEKTKLLKNEYLLQKILPEHYLSTEYWLSFLILPLFLTFFALWPMQYLTRMIYKRHIENKKAEENIKAAALTARAELETKILNAETAVFQAEVAQAKIEKEAKEVSPELIWKKEFEEFKKHELFSKFQKVIDSVYSNSGKTYVHEYSDEIQEWYTFSVPQDVVVYSDVNELISKDSTGGISFTPKGKAFVRYYTNALVG